MAELRVIMSDGFIDDVIVTGKVDYRVLDFDRAEDWIYEFEMDGVTFKFDEEGGFERGLADLENALYIDSVMSGMVLVVIYSGMAHVLHEPTGVRVVIEE